MDLALEIDGLTKNYADFTLDDVSFELPRGSIMGFVGENGAGKTTTTKLILNLIKRDAGSVRILGLDNIAEERSAKAKIGVVLDECGFHESLTASGISRILSGVFSDWNERAYGELLGRFGLPPGKTLKEYSKGMKTKLSIAIALTHDPQLLLLDEPTSGLDPVARADILDVFLDFIQDERRSVLFSSHITTDLERVADYITFIRKGRIVMSDSKDRLLADHAVLKCGSDDLGQIDPSLVAGVRRNRFSCEVLVRDAEQVRRRYPDLVLDPASLDDIMVFCAKGTAA